MNYELAQLIGERGWLISTKAFHRTIVPMIRRAAAATQADLQAAQLAYAQRPTGPTMAGDVAVINISGPITYESSWFSLWFGATAIMDLQAQFRTALSDPAVRTIVFRVNSPGGVIDMVREFADEVYAARGQKPILAVADTLVASAAYWIAAQADTIYTSPSGQLGAIGIYCEHDDISGMLEKQGVVVTLISHGDHKTDQSPYEPLSAAARADLQADVDEIGGWFDGAVARGRRVTTAVVQKTFGQGKVFRGERALSLGLADKKGTFGQVLAKLTKGQVSAIARAQGVASPVPVHAAVEEPDDELDETTLTDCETCSPDCPCELVMCPTDCPTCDEDCACRGTAAKATADQAALAAADEAAILAVLLSGHD